MFTENCRKEVGLDKNYEIKIILSQVGRVGTLLSSVLKLHKKEDKNFFLSKVPCLGLSLNSTSERFSKKS